MSNRRRLKPRREAIVDELARASACDACGSRKVLQRWRQGTLGAGALAQAHVPDAAGERPHGVTAPGE